MAFNPTLRLSKVTEADLAGSPYSSAAEVQATLTNFFENISLQQKPDFTSERIEIIETGEVITNYAGMVVGKFYRDSVLHLQLGSGDVVAIQVLTA